MGKDPKKLYVGFPEKVVEIKTEKLMSTGFKNSCFWANISPKLIEK